MGVGTPDVPVVILGAGPAGLGLAYRLVRRGWRDVTVLERQSYVGGNAASFVVDGIPVDFGSHRLHPTCPPEVLGDIRALLGPDLLERPRNGRLRLRGRWLRFPLRPIDLAMRVPPSFACGVAVDGLRILARGCFARAQDPRADDAVEQGTDGDRRNATFASVLQQGLGRTICRDFYFPYAEKIWGLPPDALDAEQARRRVSGRSLGAILQRLMSISPSAKPATKHFYYPRRGYGQISEAYRAAVETAGARVITGAVVTYVDAPGPRVRCVRADVEGVQRCFPAALVCSTIPITRLVSLVRTDTPAPPEAANTLEQRSLILVYLTLAAERFTEFDAHYFPERTIRISRLSEPKHYSMTDCPERTVLCAELPCSRADAEWTMDDGELAAVVTADLLRAGLGPMPPVTAVQVRRLPNAYPIYRTGYRAAFRALDRWVAGIDGLVTVGRQGLFVHDNTHHALAMAYALADCLSDDGRLDRERWAAARRTFESHVVED